MHLELRPVPDYKWQYLSPLLATMLTLLSGWLLFAWLTDAPGHALYVFFIAGISDAFGLSEWLLKATPMLLCAYGLAICYRASLWNIGAEGQLLMGALVGSAVALEFLDSESSLAIPSVILAGMTGGALWALLAGLLKFRFNTSEILTTIMLNYIAMNLLQWAVYGPLKDPGGFNFPESALFSEATLLPVLWPDTRLHVGFLFTCVVMPLTWLLLAKSFVGFQIQVAGQDPKAAVMAGYPVKRLGYVVLLISGALAGLAGAVEVIGPLGQLVPTVSPGYGYSAIIIALLGRLHPVGITLAGLLVSLLFMGAELSQIEMGLSSAIASLFQGLLLFFFLACDVLIRYRIRFSPGTVTPQPNH
ncbi:ABC transporter permease [Alteromonas lipolytica]|uniref:Sugar ABC transporter permease n=1 Tax=Alteromonas lipolytica TaxID=1856405 RepID=A0A1E8FJ47_9ALTE|nr:ABC transporter permease [Alteromonas lipolytica]OFI35945.1 sugar ABC transporter permease [Alteromonas lipolytica]GGF72333.1 ABC transporter permease [Alteromonas lipolytica]